MRQILIIISVAFIFTIANAQSVSKKFYQMSHQEIDSVLREISKKPLTITEKMNLFSEYFLGMPYNLHCVGDGPYALYEAWPLVNFKETNCMSYCEHVLALSISDYWDNFFNNLQQIRYRDGLIGMKTRNHYTMADWLPQNSWLLQDVTRKVGGALTRKVTRTISHRKFFAGKGISDTIDVLPDRKLTIDYIPLQDLIKVKERLKNGDICALIFNNKDDIFSAHMVMIMDNNGQQVVRESTTRGMSTFDTAYDTWVEQLNTKYKDRYIGLAVMRVRDELNTPGKIIKPWEIAGLKNKLRRGGK
ncbi:N-acetylmuramoyl-L-alanine amidase-like domain-containing protein [Calditrichota bacterium GD2]